MMNMYVNGSSISINTIKMIENVIKIVAIILVINGGDLKAKTKLRVGLYWYGDLYDKFWTMVKHVCFFYMFLHQNL